ncbi:MAG TPA: hypothetical protein VJT49_19335 [Amycolatopsis sp.]|uniref:hypothetical protein n=1 Tax=Amycolatopsis sp. TaxID=37632 RepID=UPI002B47CABC|nr:hypothetical protein [Amycolatopsis sp.]HKS47220.1 hypothetical protein [Amycolatopsis sp.]
MGTTTREATGEEQRLAAEVRRFSTAPFDGRPVRTADEGDLDLRLFRTTYLPAFVAAEALEENQRPIAWLRLTTPSGVPTALGDGAREARCRSSASTPRPGRSC